MPLHHSSLRRFRQWLWGLLLISLVALAQQPPATMAVSRAPASEALRFEALRFQIQEGPLLNAFLREGPVAAHVLLRSTETPRIIVAFPAGNSGVGLWFEHAGRPAHWRLTAPLQPLRANDENGRQLYGVSAEIEVDAAQLMVRDAVLGSLRVLRDFEREGKQPPSLRAPPLVTPGQASWQRHRIDGATGYRIAVEMLAGSRTTTDGDHITLRAAPGHKLRFRLRALSGEQPMTPLQGAQLLRAGAAADARSRQVLEFLSYREKFLAGSWRFDTYFGRDTLMSLRLLMPVLQPQAMEAGIDAVLARLSPEGEVAHEEDIGEFAVMRHLREGGAASAEPIYDYAMVDDDFMLAPVAAAWLLDDPRGHARAAGFLATRTQDGRRTGDALVRNLDFVAARTAAFAADPSVPHLVGLKEGRTAGQWRDSNEGIGRGRYPYDVNAVFVPAALRAIGGFVSSGLLDPYTTPEQRARLATAAQSTDIWERRTAELFAVTLPVGQAVAQVKAYAAHLGVSDALAVASLGTRPLDLHALSLDAQGRPVPVLHSDDGFLLLFGRPSAARVGGIVDTMMRPFPAGLMTDAGLLVANPVFAGPDAWERLGKGAYHGTVVWSWQQAMLAAGLDRQLARTDLPVDARDSLRDASVQLWRAIGTTSAVQTSELWSWSYADGRYRVEPFGARRTDEDESNAAQLWSTVFLALTPPPAVSTRAQEK
ncbi:MAG TPA: hypothetical protein VIT22_05880 [Pseudoxanthomonas sp.]